VNQEFSISETPDLRLLASFSHVAQLGSVTQAASELGYVPSAISQHITSLERSLGGITLFARRPGSRLTLTSEGRAIARAADELLAASATFRDTARRVSSGEGVTIRIGAYATALTHLLPLLFRKLVQTEALSSVRTVEIEPVDGLPLLERGELDALIAHRYLPEQVTPGRSVEAIPLGSEPLLLVTAEGAPPRTFEECVPLEWVAGQVSDADRQLLQRWAADAGLKIRVRHETRDCTTAAELIAADLAVGFLPASVTNAAWLRDRLRTVPLPGNLVSPAREVIAMTRKDFAMPVVHQLLIELRQALKQIREELP
jgi:DNA-binding transcriptional LysR family regulator